MLRLLAARLPRTATNIHGSDFWPNALFDSREGELVDLNGCSGSCANPTLAGTMYYVELDIGNLAKCMTGTAAPFSTYCSWATNLTNSNGEGYSIYFSDRRSEQTDPNPPASVGTSAAFTGGYGYDDVVNSSDSNGCPVSSGTPTLQTGEDLEGDYTNGVDSNALTVPRTYGNYLNPPSPRTAPTYLWPLCQTGCTTAPTAWNMTLTTTNPWDKVLTSNSNACSSVGRTWPFAMPLAAKGEWELRENPAIFFRRALKIVDGSSISIGTAASCNGVNCGLTIVSENPVYVQGDFNNNPNSDATFATPTTDTHVGTSIMADAITALSNSWNDVNSFISPYNWGGRTATQTTYRFAMMAGRGCAVPGAISRHRCCRRNRRRGAQPVAIRGKLEHQHKHHASQPTPPRL